AVEEFHGHERIKEILDAARVQLQLRAEFRAREAAAGKLGEHAEFNGGEQNFGGPKRKSRLQNGRWIGCGQRHTRIVAMRDPGGKLTMNHDPNVHMSPELPRLTESRSGPRLCEAQRSRMTEGVAKIRSFGFRPCCDSQS